MLFARGGTTSGSAVSAPGRRPPIFHTPATSAGNATRYPPQTGANRCAQCSKVAACPWPEPPAAPHRRTEEEALHRHIGGAHALSHERAGPAGATLLWIHVHLQNRTSVAHLSHMFAP